MTVAKLPPEHDLNRTQLFAQLAEILTRVRSLSRELDCIIALLSEGSEVDGVADVRPHHYHSTWRN